MYPKLLAERMDYDDAEDGVGFRLSRQKSAASNEHLAYITNVRDPKTLAELEGLLVKAGFEIVAGGN